MDHGNNITATEGEYLAYGTYKPSKETFYLVLNDSNRTVTLVTYNKNSQDFSFEFAGMTESEVLEMKKMDANTSDTTGTPGRVPIILLMPVMHHFLNLLK